MNLPTLQQIDWLNLATRFSKRVPAQQLNRFFSLVLVLLLAWLAARLTWLIWPAPAASPQIQPDLVASVQATGSPSLDALLAAHLFGQYQEKS